MSRLPGGGSHARAARAVNPDVDLARGGFGLAVGHATDAAGGTGLTVVRGIDAPMRASAHVFGRATGTRELSLLDPSASNDRIDAILLTGGSAYGLDAAAGVMQWMEERGRGFFIGGGVVPIVPAAVVFDLFPLGRFNARPTSDMAYRACAEARSHGIEEGSVGAGTGCTVGKILGHARAMKGGVGVAIAAADPGPSSVAAAAVAVVNAFGHVRDLANDIAAGPRGDSGTPVDTESRVMRADFDRPSSEAASTTISVVALNVALTKVELHQVACAAAAAYHRQIGPAGTSYDGDVIFAVSPLEGRRAPLLVAEVAATLALRRAIVRAVEKARGRDGIPGLAD